MSSETKTNLGRANFLLRLLLVLFGLAASTTGARAAATIWEAESMSPVGTGATVSTSADTNATNGILEFLNSTAAGQLMTLTTPSIAAGTYQVQFRYKTNTSRGQHTVKFDGTQLGGTIDQYATTSTYLTTTLGTVTFDTTATHTIMLTVIGKDSAATKYYITADIFTLTPQAAPPSFSPGGGNYAGPQIVTVASATSGASMRYTTNGSTPSETAGTIYSSPVNISSSTTLEAMAYKSGLMDSPVTSASYAINSQPVVAAPTFSPPAGTYTGTQAVSISTSTSGASIRYTTDGSTPSETNGTLYSSALNIATTTTLNAIAYKSGMTDSAVTTGTYTINQPAQVAAPAFSPPAGTYTGAQTVSISTSTSGASIHYTTDGSTPSETAGTLYSSAITIGSTTTLNAIAYNTGDTDSAVTSGTYTINLPTQVAAPAFSPVANTYTSAQTVTISSTTSGASIRYTTDDSTPSETNGTIYSSPVSIAATTTVNAIAYKSGMTDSAVTTGAYTISQAAQVAAPTFSPPAGTYTSAQTVTISSTTSGASIRYTTDGSTPSETNGTIYSSPVSITATTTLNAIAYKSGMTDSAVTIGTYTINQPAQAAAPAFSPVANTYTSAQTVTISSTTSGASIRYTMDGSTPSETAGTLYSGAVTVGTTTTLKAIAYKTGDTDSAVTTATYTISSGPIIFAAESLSPTGSGATVSTSSDLNATGGLLVFLNATGTGQTLTLATPSIAAGTYQVQFRYKTNTTRGQHTVKIDGTQLGGTIDQYATTSTYLTAALGNVTFSSTATHTIVLTVTGKNGSSSKYTITADSFTFTSQAPQVATPTFSPAANTYTSAQTVTISSTTSGASIRYTTDNSTPSETAGTLYSGAVTISATTTLKAIAYEAGFTDSNVASGTYTLTVAAPAFSPGAGTYTSAQSVTISSATSGATIRYTTSSTAPTATTGTIYSGPVPINATTTLQAIAYENGYTTSTVTASKYTINLPTAVAPTFSPAPGNYSSAQTVTISAQTIGSWIAYTTDGSTPTANGGSITHGTFYTMPVPISTSTTLKAIAYEYGYTVSSTASAAYTINVPVAATPTFSLRAGTYSGVQSVTITSATNGAWIAYTTDGSTPSETGGIVTNGVSLANAGAITMRASTTLKAIAFETGYADSSAASAVYTLTIAPLAAPIFSPGGGNYASVQTVTITSTTSGASIDYTTDGSTPTETNGTVTNGISLANGGTITISANTTLRAITYESYFVDSAVTSGTYTIHIAQTAAPTFEPAAGTYKSFLDVTITSATSGASIAYTTDGSTPTESGGMVTHGTLYTSPIFFYATTTLKAIAYGTGLTDSAVATSIFTINLPPAKAPTFSLPPGTYTGAQTVTVTVSSGSIVYTTDGSTPTESGGTVTNGTLLGSGESISISATTTLKAITFSIFNNSDSSVATAIYTISMPPSAAAPSFSPAAGTYTSAQAVTITSATSGASICYTTDGSTPTENGGTITNGMLYSNPVSASSTTMLKAIAYKTGYSGSPVATAAYTINSSPAGILNVIYNFTLSNGGYFPEAGLVQGSDGNFYGTAMSGGSNNNGTVFKVTPAGVLTTLISFNGANGADPTAGLVQGSDGNFYGTTASGGSTYVYGTNPGDGTVFKITSAGVLTTLVSFNGANGANPSAALVQGIDGNFYGTTSSTVFKITSAGVLTTLVSFNDANGAIPSAALVQGSDGNFYGTTKYGGSTYIPSSKPGYGTVFKMTQAGVLITLASFNGTNGAEPQAALVQGGDGNFYGTTGGYYDDYNPDYGTIFKITPGGVLTTLYSFDGDANGGYSQAALVQGNDGYFYGTTGLDTIFKMTATGLLTTLVSLDGANGSSLEAGLVQGHDGDFYGTTFEGGSTNKGVVFQLIAPPQVAMPAFNPASGNYTNAQTVTITSKTSGTSIAYTTDDSTPTESGGTVTHGTLYSAPLTIGTATTLTAIGFKANFTDSAPTSGSYTFMPQVATPVFSPAGGTYTSVQNVTITSATSGTSIAYTTNGLTPTESGGRVISGTLLANGGTITISTTSTLTAIAFETGNADSAASSSTYTINLPSVAVPIFSPAAGTYTSAENVTITSATSGASIIYTTDGTTPTESGGSITHGTLYSNPLNIASSTVLNAIAYESDFTDSSVISGAYTIEQLPTITPPGNVSIGSTNYLSLSFTATDATGSITSMVLSSTNPNIPTITLTNPTSGSTWTFDETSTLPPGIYTLTATAYDNHGFAITSTPVTVTVLPSLPYLTDFESSEGYTQGSLGLSLNQQLGWSVPQGLAIVTNADDYSGSQSVFLQPGTLPTPIPAQITQNFAPFVPPAGDPNIIFVDFYAKPVAETDVTTATTFNVGGARFAFVLSGAGQGTLEAFNGDGAGDGGGTWTPTNFTAPLVAGNQSRNWIRLTARLDFTHTPIAWDLYANGQMVAADQGFLDSTITALATFSVIGDAATASEIDDILAGTDNPLFTDANNDGIPDSWEQQYNLSTAPGSNDCYLELSGNGQTVLYDYINGLDPNTYYNGITPTITTQVGPNSEAGPDGLVSVQMTQSNGAILSNAPVNISVTSGGQLSSAPGGPQSEQITVQTNSQGIATFYLDFGSSSSETVSVNGGNASAQLTAQPSPQLLRSPVYFIQPLPLPTGVTFLNGGVAMRINDNGQVIGYGLSSTSNDVGILWTNGQPLILPSLGGAGAATIPYAINNHGAVVGSSGGKAFLWTLDNGMTDLQLPNGGGTPVGINDAGQISGYGNDGVGSRGFVWQTNSYSWMLSRGLQDIVIGPINNAGNVAAAYDTSVVLYSSGSIKQLSVTPTPYYPSLYPGIYSMNSSNEIAGNTDIGGGTTIPLFWNAAGSPSALTLPAGTTTDLFTTAAAISINDREEIVGLATKLDESSEMAVYWPNGSSPGVDLDTLIVPAQASSWQLTQAHAINNSGQIVGVGLYNNVSTPCLLTPLPQMAVDANRDGEIHFPNEIVDPSLDDTTSVAEPFRFWLNDEVDGNEVLDGDTVQADLDPSQNPANCVLGQPGKITCTRDLENFARLWINLPAMQSALIAGNLQIGLKWQPGYAGNPSINIYSSADSTGSTSYLTDATGAAETAQMAGTFGNALTDATGKLTVDTSGTFIFPKTVWAGLTQANPVGHFLFEGVGAGTGQLTIVILDANNNELGEGPSLYMDLEDIKQFYERWTVGDGPTPNPSSGNALAPYSGGGLPNSQFAISTARLPAGITQGFQYGPSTPGLSIPTDPNGNKYILFVHGYNLQPWEKDTFAATALKRLYWQGYKGKFGAFQWPATYHTSDLAAPFDYDMSEYTAWYSSIPLRNLLQQLHGASSGVYVLAHSMGNVVTGEALREAAQSGQGLLAGYVASQAAVPVQAYDINQPTPSGFFPATGPTAKATPNIYVGWMGSNNVSAASIGNFYNTNDFALNSSHWQTDERLKPDQFTGLYPPYGYAPDPAVTPIASFFYNQRYGPFTWLALADANGLNNQYEIMAFAAQAQCPALGAMATSAQGIVSADLTQIWVTDPYNNSFQDHVWHSAEFNFSNSDQASYWHSLLNQFNLLPTN